MATTTRLTLDEFLALPDTEPASEYACGEVTQKPMPGLSRYFLCQLIALRLGLFVRERKLGRIGPELRCIFGEPGSERTFVPDIAFVSWERLPRGDARAVRQFRSAPDMAIEVLSPGQGMTRFLAKIAFYLRHGVRLVWVVDPETETVTALSPGTDPQTLGRGDALDGGDVLPGLRLGIDEIFAELMVDPDA